MHIRVLKRLYNIIPLNAYIDARRSHAPIAIPKKALVITFDDGHKGNYRLLPLFRQYQVPATIFLCSSIVGTHRHYWWKACPNTRTVYALKPLDNDERLRRLAEFGFQENRKYVDRQSLSREEIKRLKSAVDLQAHSRYHPILPRCTDDQSWEEIAGSKTELEKIFGLRIYAFAYPNGDYSPREPILAKKAGYACALTIDGGYNTRDTDMFRLKRLRVDDGADFNELIVKASGLWNFFETIIAAGRYIRL
ncbi:MAG: polysaccharide deacetylase family protein, partial [Gammaproteobacteria bacterium]|nr:polysaccharide deacetylase family protein [Gammaproteobacteria bacterium]